MNPSKSIATNMLAGGAAPVLARPADESPVVKGPSRSEWADFLTQRFGYGFWDLPPAVSNRLDAVAAKEVALAGGKVRDVQFPAISVFPIALAKDLAQALQTSSAYVDARLTGGLGVKLFRGTYANDMDICLYIPHRSYSEVEAIFQKVAVTYLEQLTSRAYKGDKPLPADPAAFMQAYKLQVIPMPMGIGMILRIALPDGEKVDLLVKFQPGKGLESAFDTDGIQISLVHKCFCIARGADFAKSDEDPQTTIDKLMARCPKAVAPKQTFKLWSRLLHEVGHGSIVDPDDFRFAGQQLCTIPEGAMLMDYPQHLADHFRHTLTYKVFDFFNAVTMAGGDPEACKNMAAACAADARTLNLGPTAGLFTYLAGKPLTDESIADKAQLANRPKLALPLLRVFRLLYTMRMARGAKELTAWNLPFIPEKQGPRNFLAATFGDTCRHLLLATPGQPVAPLTMFQEGFEAWRSLEESLGNDKDLQGCLKDCLAVLGMPADMLLAKDARSRAASECLVCWDRPHMQSLLASSFKGLDISGQVCRWMAHDMRDAVPPDLLKARELREQLWQGVEVYARTSQVVTSFLRSLAGCTGTEDLRATQLKELTGHLDKPSDGVKSTLAEKPVQQAIHSVLLRPTLSRIDGPDSSVLEHILSLIWSGAGVKYTFGYGGSCAAGADAECIGRDDDTDQGICQRLV